MTGYSYYPLGFTRDWVLVPLLAAAITGVAFLVWTARSRARSAAAQWAIPVGLIVFAVAAVAYAWFFRVPRGRTAAYDALALRTFASVYLQPAGLVAAVAGFVYVVSTRFWRAPVFLLTTTAFASFFFYKIRVVPEHFWMGRRFLAVILPAALLFVAAIALSGLHARATWRRVMTTGLGVAFLVLLGLRYTEASRPVITHVEYRDVIPHIEQLAGRLADDDLVVVESRDTSEVHVLALPLAYVYARNVLVLANPVPDKRTFAGFLDWAATKYSRVLFIGGGGTDLTSELWSAVRLDHVRFKVPEYDHTEWDAYPRGPREKVFDFSLYELSDAPAQSSAHFELDVGGADDLHLIRFYLREQTEGRWMRWTGRRSFATIPALLARPQTVTLWMNDGGRPPATPLARVTVTIDDQIVGEATVGTGFREYTFHIPGEVARQMATRQARLAIITNPWNPHEALGTGDDRELGVMVDRIRIQ
jgi:hypothetical protein